MFTEYNNLPNNSRVWIYQSNREFSDKEVDFITKNATEFINNWTRHGDDLKGSFTIKYNQFLVLAVDENFNNVSGCSIDASVRFVQQLEQALQLDLMDKMNITFKDGDNINLIKLSQFQEFVKSKKINEETIVFNNLIATKEDLENNWEVPAKQSWHKRFLV
ncbi:MAG: ABC transporter ATPase [Flavobacteriia bacterium]|nr:ABC transporter ATPase [Flavobacteriia bacterium]OIP47434.1 MAG: ABC transporter ATPase [Flavobacteriaceae bacterium CG2_30_31_66]PIV96876.1 MAG: ABC transporter ATPase [Flavobacteriaceae bacterium CG17_big_fil_post_rev_8_21_14_2_50_31_13]PIX14651.1 MAG: ABC transporter ATPase [Flavobacteriaceae bacterium CG_4_8_14_3_um_filter_31_8]PIY15662.1 MAG: ABC transporter ATPase [Flavobacteriaceae bacterium CG_4_10_14_3_um_filter_31_253]PIZ09503.1 MAG: ABC transporter ATPase [Flavobacteriaceae bacte